MSSKLVLQGLSVLLQNIAALGKNILSSGFQLEGVLQLIFWMCFCPHLVP